MQHYPPGMYGHQDAMPQMMMPAYQNAITVVAAPGELLLTQPRLVWYGHGTCTPKCLARFKCLAAVAILITTTEALVLLH